MPKGESRKHAILDGSYITPPEIRYYFKIPKKKGISVAEYAALVGIPKVTIYRYVNYWHDHDLIELDFEDAAGKWGKRRKVFKRIYSGFYFKDDGSVALIR